MNHAWVAYAIAGVIIVACCLWDGTERWRTNRAWRRAQRAQVFPPPEGLRTLADDLMDVADATREHHPSWDEDCPPPAGRICACRNCAGQLTADLDEWRARL